MSNSPTYLKSQATLFGHSEVIGFGSGAFCVREMPRDDANRLIIEHHYSGKIFNSSLLHLGVYADGRLCGVLQWGYAMNPASVGRIVKGAEGSDALMELNRMWLATDAPPQAASRAIGYSVRLIKRRYPSCIVLQSFADERCGKFGGVYQACSWGYYGLHRSIFWELDGEWYHNISMTVKRDGPKWCPSAGHLQDNKDRAVRHEFRQFRYLKFLRKTARRDCLMTEQPYPKPSTT